MFKHSLNMEILKQVQRWGNSAGILVPREWLGKQVQIILIDRTLEIKKEIFDILNPYLEDIIGIYLVGSYARGEQEKDSDIDIIAVSNTTKKEIQSGMYSISIITLESIKKALKNNPVLILPRLMEARAILNEFLLKGLINLKMNSNSISNYLDETKSIIKINKGLLKIGKQKNEYLDSPELIYSLILRMRGLFLIELIKKGKSYSKKDFLRLLESVSKNKASILYEIYKNFRDDKKTKPSKKIEIKLVENLISLLELKIKELEKLIKR